jgi:AcrR family transcriptional regulator
VTTHKLTPGNFVDADRLLWRLLDSHPPSQPTGTTGEARCGTRWDRRSPPLNRSREPIRLNIIASYRSLNHVARHPSGAGSCPSTPMAGSFCACIPACTRDKRGRQVCFADATGVRRTATRFVRRLFPAAVQLRRSGTSARRDLTKAQVSARERLLTAAYELFAIRGINQVGIDTILARSGCAKASFYGNFKSKLDLAIAFLDRREEVWTRNWLEAEIERRATDPVDRLLAIFDAFDGWFSSEGFEGCSFINVLLETNVGNPLHRASAAHLSKIRAIIRDQAEAAGFVDPEVFAQAWHMLMKGSIVAAGEGNQSAAVQAKRAAQLIIDGWPRKDRRARSSPKEAREREIPKLP